jgi:hypothetical protein
MPLRLARRRPLPTRPIRILANVGHEARARVIPSDRSALVAVALSGAVSTALVVRVLAIGKPEVMIILVPAVIGLVMALVARGRAMLIGAGAVTSMTALVSLIGGVGLLYVPSIVLFARAAFARTRVAAP